MNEADDDVIVLAEAELESNPVLETLSWCIDEIRQSLAQAMGHLDDAVESGSDLAAAAQAAREAVHQAAGALQLIELPGPGLLLGEIERLLESAADGSVLLTADVVNRIGRGFDAATGYLDELLQGGRQQPLYLYPYYRAVLEARGIEHVEASQLFLVPGSPELAAPAELELDAGQRNKLLAHFETGLLHVLKGDLGSDGVGRLYAASRALGRTTAVARDYGFWLAAHGLIEALAARKIEIDVPLKRLLARLNHQVRRTLEEEEAAAVPAALLRDVLFAVGNIRRRTPAVLEAVAAWKLDEHVPADYRTPRYTRVDRRTFAVIADAIRQVKQHWELLSAGEHPEGMGACLATLREALESLGIAGVDELATTWVEVGRQASQGTERVDDGLALEVAGSLLFAEEVFREGVERDEQVGVRSAELARRLQGWLADGHVEDEMPAWLRELANRAHERATMASFVGATRTRLGDVERALDDYFRDRTRRDGLPEASAGLREVGGVLSLVGQEEAARAAQALADRIETFEGEAPDADEATCEALADSIGTLGFLVEGLLRGGQDTVDYRFDEASGTFSVGPRHPLREPAGRAADPVRTPHEPAADRFSDLGETRAGHLAGVQDDGETVASDPDHSESPASWREAVVSEDDAPAHLAGLPDVPGDSSGPEPTVAEPVVAEPVEEDVDSELLEIFLVEAGEVLETMRESLETLQRAPGDEDALTTLRRGYHTLKGSSRMVGLMAFGELAWHFEQLLNTWIGEGRSWNALLGELIDVSMGHTADWVDDLAAAPLTVRESARLIEAADALRESRELPARPWVGAEPAVGEPAADEPSADDTDALVEDALAEDALVEDALVEDALVEDALAEDALAEDALAEDALAEDALAEDALAEDALVEDALVEDALVEDASTEDADLEAFLHDDPGALASLVPAWDEASEAISLPEAIVVPDDGVDEMLAEVADAVRSDETALTGEADVDEAEADEAELSPDLVVVDVDEESPDPAGPASVDVDTLLAGSMLATDDIPVLDASSAIGVAPDGDAETGELPPLLTEPIDAADIDPAASADDVLVDGLRISGPLYRVFLEEADGILAATRADLDDWRAAPGRPASEAARRAMHSLKGSAAVVGVAEVERLAHELERALLAQMMPGAVATPESLDEYALLVERLAAMLHQFAAGQMPQSEPDTQDRARAFAEACEARALVAAPARAAHETPEPGAIADELDAELLPIFVEEAIDQLPEIDMGLRQWLQHPDDRGQARTLMRLLHTVKGGARMAGAMRLGQCVHEMETRIEAASELTHVPVQLVEELIAAHDVVMEMFEAIRDPASAVSPVEIHAAPVMPAVPVAAPPPGAAEPPAAAGVPVPASTSAPAAAPVRVEPAAAQTLVRVRADLLERLVNESGEVSIAGARLDNSLDAIRQSLWDLTENVARLRTQLREIEIQAETQIQTRIAAARESHEEFDPLEFDRYTRTQELTRMLAESVNDVATVQHNATRSLDEAAQDLLRQGQMLRELRQNLMRVRMVRFGSLGDRLYRVVRQAAKELGKRVTLDIRGSDVEVDRSVLEHMAAPVEHLLRNAVSHGIESPAVRLAAGKDETGEIRVAVRQEGNEVLLELRDDGGGLDLGRIRARAVEAGLLGADEAISEQGLAEMIFRPGFSTAEAVSEISGRGVGMDVVRAEVAALGGRVDIDSQPGRGTCFTVHLPLTLAITQVVLVSVGELRFALPSSSIEQVIQLRAPALAQARAERRIDWQGEAVPLYYLGALVESGDEQPVTQHYSPIVVMRAGGRRVAIHVDAVVRNQEVVVKNVGPQVARVRGVGGATILGNGEIVLILDVGPLVAATGERAARTAVPGLAPKPVQTAPTIMVVDDSLTVRKATQRLLQRERYEVMLAKDGVDALRQLQERVPDAMLVDIEMPRMGGFDLTRHVRGDARYSHVPIVMISSRTADKHRNYAKGLGVDAFLGKPYAEGELLELLRGYLARTGAGARDANED